ncbi:MAG: hypothetical protein IJH55_07650 [Romboutsia sp.]|nr:hypothetical protein [Romboutsia sp.]
MPTAARQWSLKDKVKQYINENNDGTLKIRVCQECFSTFETAPICPYCGAEYKITPIEIQNFKEIKLRKIEEEKAMRIQKWREGLDERVKEYKEPKQCKSWGELLAYARVKGYKNGYAYIMAKQLGIKIGGR